MTLLERGQVGMESSWAGAGLLWPLLPWQYSAPVSGLAIWSAGLYPEWIKSINGVRDEDPEYICSGMLVLPDYDLLAVREWCQKNHVSWHLLTAREKLPEIGHGGEALFFPDVAQIRNPKLMRALKRALVQVGVQIVENTQVEKLEMQDGCVSEVITTQGNFQADTYILAAGAWSQQLVGQYGAGLRVWPVKGQILLYRGKPGWFEHIIYQNGTYIIPRKDGHILVGSTLEETGYDKSITDEAGRSLYHSAVTIFPPLHRVEQVRHWAGLRPGSPDNVPVIGRNPNIENLYANTGHFRYGVTMAPGSARLLSDLIEGREPELDSAPYIWKP